MKMARIPPRVGPTRPDLRGVGGGGGAAGHGALDAPRPAASGEGRAAPSRGARRGAPRRRDADTAGPPEGRPRPCPLPASRDSPRRLGWGDWRARRNPSRIPRGYHVVPPGRWGPAGPDARGAPGPAREPRPEGPGLNSSRYLNRRVTVDIAPVRARGPRTGGPARPVRTGRSSDSGGGGPGGPGARVYAQVSARRRAG